MLARRFTIVCLLLTLFGMLMSTLVAHTGRAPRSWETGRLVPCVAGPGCVPPSHR